LIIFLNQDIEELIEDKFKNIDRFSQLEGKKDFSRESPLGTISNTKGKKIKIELSKDIDASTIDIGVQEMIAKKTPTKKKQQQKLPCKTCCKETVLKEVKILNSRSS
jgi:hypothetical protein